MDRPPRALKRFGQHFLHRADIAQRIVALAEIRPGDSVLEVGPGRGALTGLLAEQATRLVLVEIDRALAAGWREQFAGRPTVTVVEGNVLDLDLPRLLGAHAPVVVVANLPYNISTPVLARFLATPELFRRFVLMLQREVAERLSASAGTKSYGALSVMVQVLARVRIALHVPPTAFVPRPAVESAVVVIDPLDPPPLTERERRSVRQIVRTVFSQRRKQLRNALGPLTATPGETLLGLGIDPTRRPETLLPADFVALARAIEPGAFAPVAPVSDTGV